MQAVFAIRLTYAVMLESIGGYMFVDRVRAHRSARRPVVSGPEPAVQHGRAVNARLVESLQEAPASVRCRRTRSG